MPSATQTREVPAPSGGLSVLSLEGIRHPTPFLACDTSVLAAQHGRLAAALPRAALHYAVKCNPAPEVLSMLAARGCHFEVASIRELEMVEATGTPPSEVLFSNPVKPVRDIAGFETDRYEVDESLGLFLGTVERSRQLLLPVPDLVD